MRILIISKYFPPENSVASLRPYSWAKFWSRAGHDVSVLTCVKPEERASLKMNGEKRFKVFEIDYNPFYYKLQNLYLGNSKPKSLDSVIGSDKQVSADLSEKVQASSFIKQKLKKLNDFRQNRGILSGQRMPDTMDFWISPALQWARQNGPWDLIISTYAPYACHVIAYHLKKEGLTTCWVADFRDPWTDHHIFKGLFPFTYFERKLEHLLMNQTDVITTVSEPLAATLASKYGKFKVHAVENGFDPEDLQELPESRYFQDNKIRIIHTGTIYPGRMDPSLLFEAIASIAADNENKGLLDNLEVLFVGAFSDIVAAKAEKMNVSKWVKNGGFLPREDVLRMQREAHVLLYFGFDKSKAPGLLSGKMYEYMFSGTLIWAIEVNELSTVGQIFVEANAGILFGEDRNLLKQHLIRLLQNPIKQKAETDKQFINNFTRSTLAYKMLDLVKKSQTI